MRRHTRPTGAVRIWAEIAKFKYSNLCTHTCPYRLGRLSTSLRVRGKRTTKEESNQVFINEIEWKLPQKNRIQTASRIRRFDDRGKNRKRKLSPDTGKVSAELTKGAGVSRNERGKNEQKGKNSFLQNGIKYLPFILERR